MVLIRGVPVERYGKDRASAVYWGVGTHLGHPWPQNAKGHLLGDVTDQGRALDDPTARGNELGGIPLPFHSDGSDLVGLFCLDAGAGGATAWCTASPSTTTWCGTIPTWPPSCTSRTRTTCGRAGPRLLGLVHHAGLHPAPGPAVRSLHPALHRVVGATPTPPARPSGPRPSTGSTPCAPTPSTGWPWGCGRATCSS